MNVFVFVIIYYFIVDIKYRFKEVGKKTEQKCEFTPLNPL
jgi:hypothetical protein